MTKKINILIYLLFVAFTVWWLYITFVLKSPDHGSSHNQAFGATYGVMALLGGLVGLTVSRIWGSYRSLVGRAVLFFALGLLAQEFGQLAYSYYTYVLHVDIPYPSIGDIGYFGSVLLYIYATLQLARAAGVGFTLKDRSKKVIAVLLPALLLVGSYIYFLKGYHFDFHSLKAATTVVLDLGYPLGQATYIALALVTYLLSRGILGGVMKKKVLLILFALVIQYVADFTFLNAAKANTAFPGGANDFVYLLAYTVMALALTNFRPPRLKSDQKAQS